jgi:hypothetical protein
MIHRSRAQWVLLVTVFLAAGIVRPAFGMAQECTDLPISSLKVYRLNVDQVSEQAATQAEIDEVISALSGSHHAHPLMAIVDAIDTRTSIEHRIVGRPQGYCDAPEAVLLGLGVTRREVFILREAAADPCVKAALLEHEAEHDRALGSAIHDFIQQHRPQFAQRLEELKKQTARDRQAAASAFEAGLQMFLATMMKEFKEEKIGDIKLSVDSVSRLAALSNACDGRLGELEKISRGEAL